MTSATKGTFPSDPSGGDVARALYDELADDLLWLPDVARATMMGNPSLRLHGGPLLASYDPRARCLVLKLPSERVAKLVESEAGEPFAPAGRGFREWIAIQTVDRTLWRSLLDEAVDFARNGSAR